MSDLKCPTRVCYGHINIVGEWEDNDYCSFAAAECTTCPFPYWVIKRDGKLTIRHRDDDDDGMLFDNRDPSEIR